MELKGVLGKKNVDLILNFFVKYEGYSNFGKFVIKVRMYLENLVSFIKVGVKFGLEKIVGYENLLEMVLKGGFKVEFVGKFLGKLVKIIGKGVIVLIIVDISIMGLLKGIDEYLKIKDIGKVVKKGVLFVVVSVGFLEGVILGVIVGGVLGVIIGGGIGFVI